MIFKTTKYFLALFPLAVLFSAGQLKSQPLVSDSLTLGTIISEVVQNHPLVKRGIEELTTSDAKIGIANASKQPEVDFTSSYSRIGPISEITIPGMGSFAFMPKDNYSAGVNVNQTISDFGKTDKNISLEKQGREVNRQSLEQVKQRLSQAAINNYYALVYLQEAIKIKEEQLNTLNEHLVFVQKKQATGSATQYEILTTQVRISAIENQKTDLETSREVQVSHLNSLLGKPEQTKLQVKIDLNLKLPEIRNDSLISSAMQNRDEMKLVRQRGKLAMLHYNLTLSQNNPVLNAFASGGVRNGYIPYMYDPRANFVAGIGLRVPIFDGRQNKYRLVEAKTAIAVNDQETEISRRNIIDEVIESESGLRASQKKVDQSALQLRQASQAYDLAKARFDAGVITNLELLDGSTAVSESRLMLLKSRIDYTVNVFKLKSSIGERLY
ncbi:MAG: TolC family protein [Mariniphaga sp.]